MPSCSRLTSYSRISSYSRASRFPSCSSTPRVSSYSRIPRLSRQSIKLNPLLPLTTYSFLLTPYYLTTYYLTTYYLPLLLIINQIHLFVKYHFHILLQFCTYKDKQIITFNIENNEKGDDIIS